jgi:hypothetical protein
MLRFEKSFLLVFVLLFFSGNPLASFIFGKFGPIISLVITLFILKSNSIYDYFFNNELRIILFTISIIASFQYLFLPVLSFLALLNLVTKILMAGLILYTLKEEFPFVFFKVISWLSLISLIGFIVFNLFELSLPNIQVGQIYKSFILYGLLNNEALDRNAGMFWEPGAFAGVITLCLGVNFRNLKSYWQIYRYDLLLIIIALITTKSTTGFFVGFIILIFYFLNPKKILATLLIIFCIMLSGLYVYNSTEFLKDKVDKQFNKSNNQRIGDFSNSRFGSLIFDWHYISKHPFIGNGFDTKTRYSDHQFLFRGAKGDVIGSGNAFSGFLASMGIFFVFGYFALLRKATLSSGKLFSLILFLVVFFNLQGEQWFNYPLYLGLPFLKFEKLNFESNIDSEI